MNLTQWLGDAVEDAGEETFLLFSQDLPSHSLGFLDGKASSVNLDVAGREFTLKQSPGLLNSQRESGTTGAVLWNITPLVGEWLVSLPKWLKDARVLHTDSNVVELGCGITGLLGMLLAEKVSTYFLTDQTYVMKALRENVERNSPGSSQNKKSATPGPSNLRLVPLDWETDSAQGLLAGVPTAEGIDLVILCDCVYNEYLIRPLIQTLVELCTIGSANLMTTILIAQQLRSDTVFELFLEALLQRFVVWRVPDANITLPLCSGSGYVVHLAQLRQDETYDGSQSV